MKIVVARRIGRRGEGLGNEMIAWAKGAIACEVLGAKLIGPGFGINKRRYYRNFGTSRADWILEDVLIRLPHHAFTEADYVDSGELDFGLALQKWANARGLNQRSSFIVSVDGMYGGYPSIRNARSFLHSKLLNSRDAVRNVMQISSALDPKKLFVAVHMRSTVGGHLTVKEGEDLRGRFNLVVPGQWYLRICQALRDQLGDAVQFHFFTDRGGEEYQEAIRRFNPGQITQTGLTECSDLLLMAQADLRICSISSYSLMANFLSGGPYLWYEPQLNVDDGIYNIWGKSSDQRIPGSNTMLSREFAATLKPDAELEANLRGYFVRTGNVIPPGLIQQMHRRLRALEPRTDLVAYGSLPSWTGSIE